MSHVSFVDGFVGLGAFPEFELCAGRGLGDEDTFRLNKKDKKSHSESYKNKKNQILE